MKYLLLTIIALSTIACDKNFDSDWSNEKRSYANTCMTEIWERPIVLGDVDRHTGKSMKEIYVECAKQFDTK